MRKSILKPNFSKSHHYCPRYVLFRKFNQAPFTTHRNKFAVSAVLK